MPYEYSLYPRDLQAQQVQHQSPRNFSHRHSSRSLDERIAGLHRALNSPQGEHSSLQAIGTEQELQDMVNSIDSAHHHDEAQDDIESLTPKKRTDSRLAHMAPDIIVEDFQKRFNIPSGMPSTGRTTPGHRPVTGRTTPSHGPAAGRSTPVQQQTPGRRPVYYSSRSNDASVHANEHEVKSAEYTQRGVHVPSRTSSSNHIETVTAMRSPQRVASQATVSIPESRIASSSASVLSYETRASSINTLPPLQPKAPAEYDHMEPLDEDDPSSFDLVAPRDEEVFQTYSLEKRSEQLFSREHLQCIFDDPALLLRFTAFISTHRQSSVPLLVYYLDALKALRAINYANAVAEALEPLPNHSFTEHPARPTMNSVLEEKADQAFEELVREDLPAFITHSFVQVVTVSVQRRITGTMAPHLRDASEGLAEVFCLTDVSRPENPIVFSSEEFHRTTQYGVNYAIGRNCRFLQGPRTESASVRRLGQAIRDRREISEVLLNYRRDGSPFMNLLMMAPLFDNRGKIRYFIGAQVDVSGLVKECTNLEGLQKLLAKQAMEAHSNKAETNDENGEQPEQEQPAKKDEFQDLCEMFNMSEMAMAKKFGGRMHHPQVEDSDESVLGPHRPRLMLNASNEVNGYGKSMKLNGKLEGIFQHYLLVRPAPSLRILFTSPSLRVPGILQSPFLSRIGGSDRVKHELMNALNAGRGVTAKIRWLSSRADNEGRPRWIHCTPLLGHTGSVGVWMIVLVDDESHPVNHYRFRSAPPVADKIGGKEYRDWEPVGANGVRRKGSQPLGKQEYEATISSSSESRPATAARTEDMGTEPGSPAHSVALGDGSLNSFAL